MKSEEIWKKVVEFNDKYFPDWRKRQVVEMSNALAGEVGEVCNSVKHLIGGGTNKTPINKAKILEEMADVEFYKIMLIEVLGFSEENFANMIEDKLKENVRRMEERKKC
jgi:NTP pyrophosphatase (non-canonical NTP hydrolase)